MSEQTAELHDHPDAPNSMEAAFARVEADAEAALRQANELVKVVKRTLTAAKQGKVRDLHANAEVLGARLEDASQAVASLQQSWTFDEESYLASGGFTGEVIALADQENLRITELDGRLYCYPSLLRVMPGDRLVMIDKTRERRIRPSVLVSALRDNQNRPPRFRANAFLESLYAAYRVAAQSRSGQFVAAVIPLLELYDLFTLYPGMARDYSKAEFARDIYLLDQSGEAETKNGARIEFHAGAGARIGKGALTVVTKQGEERKYHGVSFVSASGA